MATAFHSVWVPWAGFAFLEPEQAWVRRLGCGGPAGSRRICQQLTFVRTWSSWTSLCGTPICGLSWVLLELQPPGLLGYYAKNSKPLELEVSKVGLGSSLPVAVSHASSSLRVPHPTTRLEFRLCRHWDMSGRWRLRGKRKETQAMAPSTLIHNPRENFSRVFCLMSESRIPEREERRLPRQCNSQKGKFITDLSQGSCRNQCNDAGSESLAPKLLPKFIGYA